MTGATRSTYLDGSGPRAFAHRGWHTGDLAGLENSMAAFQRAVDEGFRYLETDVHATADGVLVAFHDRVLDRVTDGRGSVATQPWSRVRTARIGGREPIPLIADVIDAFPDTRFNIDPKSDAAVGPLLDVIRTTRSGHRVCLGSFSDRRLRTLRRSLGAGVATSLGPLGVFNLVAAARLGRRARALPGVVAAQVPVRYGRATVVTPRFVAAAHSAGLEVHVWTIDAPVEMHRLLDLGVDAIMTDRPDLLRTVLTERGSWPGA